MEQNEVRAKAEELIETIKMRFICSDGFLARNYPPTNRTLFDNFDDLVPFFLYFGESDFLLSQVHTIQKKNESMLTLVSIDGILQTRNLDEWFGGLNAIWKATNDKVCFAILKESVEFVFKHFIKGNFLSGAFLLHNNSSRLYYEPWSSGLLEVFCEMRDDFPQAFEQAMIIMRNWIDDDYFKRYGLFPYRSYDSSIKRFLHRKLFSKMKWLSSSRSEPGLRKESLANIKYLLRRLRFEMTSGWYSQLMKSNSTPAFTLLEFYRATGDRYWIENLLMWCKSALNAFYEHGKIYMHFNPETKTRYAPSVTAAFILVDVICDATWAASEFNVFLPKAKKILDYQWNNRMNTGLVPFWDQGRFAHIDSQIDLSISMRKYAEISEEEVYLRRSKELLNNVFTLHYSPEGYFTYSGEVRDNVIDPKYNALALKGLISLLETDSLVYPDFYYLFKDR